MEQKVIVIDGKEYPVEQPKDFGLDMLIIHGGDFQKRYNALMKSVPTSIENEKDIDADTMLKLVEVCRKFQNGTVPILQKAGLKYEFEQSLEGTVKLGSIVADFVALFKKMDAETEKNL